MGDEVLRQIAHRLVFQQFNNHLLPGLGPCLVLSLPIQDKQTALIRSTAVLTRVPQPLPPLGRADPLSENFLLVGHPSVLTEF